MSLDRRVRFQKMGEAWGVNGPAEVCKVGATIEVEKRAGGTSRVKILSARPARPGYVDCTIESMDRRPGAPAKAAAPRSARTGVSCCRGCRGPIVNAPHHRAMGGYCGTCAFDEFDC